MTEGRHIAETERTRANLMQVGTIAEADYASARVRVTIGGLVSAWLPWITGRAGGDRTWAAPEIGEQVLVACPDGDPASGVVVGAIYQADHGAPADSADVHRTTYSDGAVIEYDRAAHALRASLPDGGSVTLTSPGGITISAPQVSITGDLSVTGTLTASADVIADGVSLTTHVHSGVDTGPGTTGEPL